MKSQFKGITAGLALGLLLSGSAVMAKDSVAQNQSPSRAACVAPLQRTDAADTSAPKEQAASIAPSVQPYNPGRNASAQ